ncbi:hypothetical protein ACTFSR_27225, partial [Bacillus cereus group sp. MYBK132-1]
LATVALSLTYFFQLAHFLRFAFLIFLNLQQLPFLLPISPYLHFLCALLSLTLLLATVALSLTYLPLLTFPLRFAFLNSSTCNSCSFSYLFLSTCTLFALCFPYISQLATVALSLTYF